MCRNLLVVHGAITATAGEDNLDVNFRSLCGTESPRRHNLSISFCLVVERSLGEKFPLLCLFVSNMPIAAKLCDGAQGCAAHVHRWDCCSLTQL